MPAPEISTEYGVLDIAMEPKTKSAEGQHVLVH